MTKILFKRGLETNRTQVLLGSGEPLVTTDDKELWIGDGTSQGGWPVGTIKTQGVVAQGDVAIYSDPSGKVLGGVSKATFLNGYATEAYVGTQISSVTPSIKVNAAALADKATDADNLGGEAPAAYIKVANITTNYQEDDSTKVVSASGIKAFFTAIAKTITDGLGLKVDKTSISQDVNSSDQTRVASSYAVKKANDLATAAQTSATANSNTLTTLNNQVQVNKHHLSLLPGKVTRGTTKPTGGSDGDIYVQYK